MIVAPPPAGDLEPTAPPAFSVIVAAHNAAATIAAAVTSALEQTRPPKEIVVCDDGSTDDLASALAPFGDRVTLVRREQRGGPAAARNTAAAAATGDFVVVLDSDDAYDPRRLEALGDLLAQRPDLDLATTDVQLERNGEPQSLFYDDNEFDVDDQRAAILRGCFPGGWPAIRRSTLLAAGGYDEGLLRAEDWDLWIRLILAGAAAGLVPEPLMTYRLHEGSLSSNRVESLRARVAVLEKAERNPDLRDAERPILAASLASYRRRLGAAELEAALATGARGDALRSSLRGGLPLRLRFTALKSAVTPRRS